MQNRRSSSPKQRFNDLDTASALALQAMAFIVADSGHASRFLSLTGLDIATLRARLDSNDMQTAVLDYLLGDESLLLAFCAEANIPPEAIAPAHNALSQRGA